MNCYLINAGVGNSLKLFFKKQILSEVKNNKRG